MAGKGYDSNFLTLFAQIDKLLECGKAIIAIEGGSASGKTTLGELLKEKYDCTVLHMDDFFLRPEQRTPERFAEVGGNIDRERFWEEVCVPLSKGENIHYRRFDCSTFEICPGVEIVPERLTVIEGAYSMHPLFEEIYDLKVYLDVAPGVQRQRIMKRNSEAMAKRFFEEWIPMEQMYFREMRVKERCDVCISVLE